MGVEERQVRLSQLQPAHNHPPGESVPRLVVTSIMTDVTCHHHEGCTPDLTDIMLVLEAGIRVNWEVREIIKYLKGKLAS